MQFAMVLQVPVFIVNIYTQAVEWIASCYANTTSTPIGMEGGEPQSGGLMLGVKWKQPKHISWSYFQLHITHKTAKFMLNLTSQSCGDL